MVDYDPLPAVVKPEDAAKDEMLLFPEAGTNVAARAGSPDHDDKLFDDCDVVVCGHALQSAHGAVPARAALVPPPNSAPTDGSPPGSPHRRRTRTAWCSPGCSGSTRRRFA